MSCKSCGGKLLLERGAPQRIMLSNVLLELSNVISPHLSWKTVSTGRQRSSRRARTSFTQAKRKNSRTKNLKARTDRTDKDSKSRCMLASESEKCVPIKKRRLLLVHTPSSPHYPSLYSDSGLEEQSASYQDALLTAKQHSHDGSPGCESELVEYSNFVLEKADLEDVTAKNYDAADFSGTSKLAAAACVGNAGGEFMNVECSTLKQQFSEDQEVPKENAKLYTAHEKEDPLPQTSKDLFGRTDLPFKDSSSSASHSKKSNDVKSDGSGNLATFVNSFQNALNKTTSSSGNVKFHWDLNIAVEEWDSHEEVLGSDQEAANNVSDVGDHNDKLGNVESRMDQVGFGGSTTDSQSVNGRDCLVDGEPNVLCVLPMKTEVTLGVSCDNLAADSNESKPFTYTRCLPLEGDVPLCADSGAVKSDETTLVCRLAEKNSDGNACEDRVNGHVIFGQNAHQNALVETDTENADKSNKKDTGQGEMAAVEVKMDNATFNLPNDEIDAARIDFLANTAHAISICNSTGNKLGNPDASPALRSQEVCINNAGQVALENHLERHYYSNAFPNYDQANRMEEVKFLGDDGSRYKDGEFRKPLANCWIYDGAEEEDNEQVDYRFYVCEAASDFSSGNRHASDMEFSDASHENKCSEVGKDPRSASQSYMNCPSSANMFDSTSSKGNAGDVTGLGFQEDLSAGGGCNDFGDDGLVKGVRKMSGWYQLPDGCGISSKGRFGSINQNQNDASSYPPRAGDSLNRVVGLSLKRDLSSRVERVRSSDMSQRKDKSYVRLARSNEHNEFSPRVERDRDDPSLKGTRGHLCFQGRVKGRGDQWMDSSNHHGNSRQDSFGYHGPASFSHLGSRNGFGIASDGMFGKSVGNISSQHAYHPSSAKSPIGTERAFGIHPRPGRSRQMSPDRPIFIGRDMPRGMDGAILREKYRGPLPDDITDASSSMHHTAHRRDHNFSPPHRRHLHVARFQSRSPSRPRSRSPHRWTSPSGRRDNVMNGSPSSRRCNRSLTFNSEARIDSSRAGFGEHVVSYAPLSRNHTSPPRAARWSDGRKEAPECFGDYENRRRQGRSPPAEVLARGRRLDFMDSAGRFKREEFSYPMYLGRSHEFVGFGRRSIQDAKCDNRRKHDDRDEMPHSAKVSLSDDKNGFMAQNLRAKFSEFQRRVNSRDFDRRRERQCGDSSHKSKEEKGHFRNGGDGEYNVNFKSFGIQDRYHNMDAQRKPLGL